MKTSLIRSYSLKNITIGEYDHIGFYILNDLEENTQSFT